MDLINVWDLVNSKCFILQDRPIAISHSCSDNPKVECRLKRTWTVYICQNRKSMGIREVDSNRR